MNAENPHDFQSDIDAVARIAAVPSILDVVCRITGMGFAAVARVTEDRWIVCTVLDQIAFGLEPGGELAVTTTICNEIRQSGEAVVIDHVAEDEVFCGHPTPAMYGFQSYISMPIFRGDGGFFGTLCAIDPRPARLRNPETIGMFRLFAELIAFHLDANDKLAQSEAALVGERRMAELREQFIAVLGHDLRNPLASIDAGTRILQRAPLDHKANAVLGLIQGSVLRMKGLIDNVLDFARGRLGGGLTLRLDDGPVELALTQVVDELRAVWPGRIIETRFSLPLPVRTDRERLAQLASNLLGNALNYGDPALPVVVAASTSAEAFELSVANGGAPIPADTMEGLFLPFARGKTPSDQKGLGLGLFIAAEIARAHGGTLTVTSTAAETRFTFRMPVMPA